MHDSPVVVITGGSAGIGRATAKAFAQRGARVALLARGHDGLEGARKEIEAVGSQALLIPTDMADPHQVEAAAEQVERAATPVSKPIGIWILTVVTISSNPLPVIREPMALSTIVPKSEAGSFGRRFTVVGS